MMIRVEQHVRTEISANRILDVIEKEIRSESITNEIKRHSDRVTTRQVIGGPTGTSFWIYRDDRTDITVEPDADGYRCVAEIDYRPSSAYHWAVWITGILSLFGWIQPVIFYHKQKRAVGRFFEEIFEAVAARLESSDSQSIEAYLAQGKEPTEEDSESLSEDEVEKMLEELDSQVAAEFPMMCVGLYVIIWGGMRLYESLFTLLGGMALSAIVSIVIGVGIVVIGVRLVRGSPHAVSTAFVFMVVATVLVVVGWFIPFEFGYKIYGSAFLAPTLSRFLGHLAYLVPPVACGAILLRHRNQAGTQTTDEAEPLPRI